MPEPKGLGIWTAFAGMAGGHERIATNVASLGVSWVAPRGGESGTRDPQWSPAKAISAIKRYHAAGLRVYPWLFSRPWSYRLEIELFKQFVAEGADGIIIDAEFAWDFGQRATASRYMEELDRALPKAWIADAPWAYPAFHPGFPFAEFGRRVNARMPQCYWTEFGTASAHFNLPRIDGQ